MPPAQKMLPRRGKLRWIATPRLRAPGSHSIDRNGGSRITASSIFFANSQRTAESKRAGEETRDEKRSYFDANSCVCFGGGPRGCGCFTSGAQSWRGIARRYRRRCERRRQSDAQHRQVFEAASAKAGGCGERTCAERHGGR